VAQKGDPEERPGAAQRVIDSLSLGQKVLVALAGFLVAAGGVVAAVHGLVGSSPVSSGPSGVGAPAASSDAPLRLIGEGKSSCPPGYLCVWSLSDYRGGGVAIFGNQDDWAKLPSEYLFIRQKVSSVYNNGHPDRFPNAVLYPSPSLEGPPLFLPNKASKPSLEPGDDHFDSNTWQQ
jgi:hypothetical protein